MTAMKKPIQTLADFEAGKGVLAICPATMTFSEEILNGVMDAAAAHQNGRGADLVGINMEGPFISPNKVGAQNPEYLHKADVAMFRRLQKRANGLIKLVDIAPEEPGALEFIAACHDEVRISIAHTCTSYDTANAAFDAVNERQELLGKKAICQPPQLCRWYAAPAGCLHYQGAAPVLFLCSTFRTSRGKN